MKIAIEATDQVTMMDNVMVRVWEGTTEAGTPCKVFVHRIAVHNDHDHKQFEQELLEQLPPAGPVVDLRHVLG